MNSTLPKSILEITPTNKSSREGHISCWFEIRVYFSCLLNQEHKIKHARWIQLISISTANSKRSIKTFKTYLCIFSFSIIFSLQKVWIIISLKYGKSFLFRPEAVGHTFFSLLRDVSRFYKYTKFEFSWECSNTEDKLLRHWTEHRPACPHQGWQLPYCRPGYTGLVWFLRD